MQSPENLMAMVMGMGKIWRDHLVALNQITTLNTLAKLERITNSQSPIYKIFPP
jgi:hypothetical protein